MKKTLLLTCLAVNLSITEAANRLDEVTVTDTHETKRLAETPASVGTLSEQAIRLVAPTQPQQILGEIPGGAVGVTNGEGHTTAIRQPFTTSPVYLFLEDGVPVRATGFFNHNALYEVNIPDASGIEVVRGPGTALYGSDAIGGIVNILTKAPAAAPEARLNAEGGSYGWYRLLVDGSAGMDAHGGWRAGLNLSHTDGWRDDTAYDRLSGNFRWDYTPSGVVLFLFFLCVLCFVLLVSFSL